jgi:ArsR family transcriptional regulator
MFKRYQIMRKFDIDRCMKPAAKFKALGHPVRFWIVQQLLDSEHCVHEFVQLTELDFSTISQHLAALKAADILATEKHGKEVYYRLVCPCTRTFIECVNSRLKRNQN